MNTFTAPGRMAMHLSLLKPTSRRILFVLAMCCLLPGTTLAQSRDYQIEVLVFENLRPGSAPGATLYVPRLGNAISLTGDRAAALGFQQIEQPSMLIEHAEQIKSSGSYRLLRHIAWQQPGLDNSAARGIRINAGSSFKVHLPGDFRDHDRFVPVTLGPAFDGNSREIATTKLSGTIKVRLGRFLHLDTRLVFTDIDQRRSFRLEQSRKMRSRELHYIDNPRFGLLVRIIPLDT